MCVGWGLKGQWPTICTALWSERARRGREGERGAEQRRDRCDPLMRWNEVWVKEEGEREVTRNVKGM